MTTGFHCDEKFPENTKTNLGRTLGAGRLKLFCALNDHLFELDLPLVMISWQKMRKKKLSMFSVVPL